MNNIDYGMGLTNIDNATGIRYGVISQHSLASWFYDSFEADYGPATCPKCGDDAMSHADVEADTDEWESAEHECADYACTACEYVFGSESAYPEEPRGHSLNEDGYRAIDCLDSDVMLLASPFYTRAPFCSPCVPGAGNLDDACTSTEPVNEDWEKTYCFGHEWFEDGIAPYRVFCVADDAEVFPEKKRTV